MKKLVRQLRHKVRILKQYARDRREDFPFKSFLLLFETLILSVFVVFAFSGSRGAALNRFGSHADAILIIFVLLILVALNFFVNGKISKRLIADFSRRQVKETEIILDLGQAARHANTIDELYNLVVKKIGEILQTESVSILVREDETDNYVCCASSLNVNNETISESSFIVKRLKNLEKPLAIDHSDFTAWERALDNAIPKTKAARKKEIATLENLHARLLLQVVTKDSLVGIIALGERKGKRSFLSEDKQLLMAVAAQMAVVIENSRLVERMVEEESLKRELTVATEVQQRLFPQKTPKFSSVELAGFCQPARGVGGDYYDFIEIDENQLGIAIADVAGKGIGAALLMSIIQASLRSQAITQSQIVGVENPLAEIVGAMNKQLWRSSGSASYATFFYAQFDENRKRLSYVNAGHNPPILLRAHCFEYESATATATLTGDTNLKQSLSKGKCEKFELLDVGGLVLGLFEDFIWQQETIDLYEGDLLFAYTDGLTEGLNKNGKEFGEENLKEMLKEVGHLSAAEIREIVNARLQVWCENAPQHDDVTFVVLKVL